jgi:hypothetical protein
VEQAIADDRLNPQLIPKAGANLAEKEGSRQGCSV